MGAIDTDKIPELQLIWWNWSSSRFVAVLLVVREDGPEYCAYLGSGCRSLGAQMS